MSPYEPRRSLKTWRRSRDFHLEQHLVDLHSCGLLQRGASTHRCGVSRLFVLYILHISDEKDPSLGQFWFA